MVKAKSQDSGNSLKVVVLICIIAVAISVLVVMNRQSKPGADDASPRPIRQMHAGTRSRSHPAVPN
jgi:hypothetical protein